MKVFASALAVVATADPDQPHLTQAWQAMSKGDGLPGQVGLESYIYTDDFKGHVWDYGANNCIKIELDTGFHNKDYPSETYYIKCDSVDCCISGEGRPDLKKWDIATPGRLHFTKTEFVGYVDTTELNDNPVLGAETWSERHAPVKFLGVNYTYRISRADGGDVISHRIDYEAPGASPGSILYGNFTPQHDLDSFKPTFKPPAACLKNNVLKCGDNHASQYFRQSSMLKKLEQELSTTADLDCTKAACPDQCECAKDQCATELDTCLSDATCAKAQDCALACACNDNVCVLKCATQNPSLKALPAAKCITSKCGSAVEV